MNTDLLAKPGYRYAEYLVILNPHEDLRNRITGIKKDFNEKFKSPGSFGGKPHVMLSKFTVWEMMEDKIINRLKVAAMGMPPFKIILKDYGSFPTHTIFINVTTKIPIQNLVKEIRKAKLFMRSPDHDPFFITDPFIAIARKLPPAVYEKAWLEYSHRSFTGSFIADGMLMLKRREGQKGYQIVQRFDFMNLPVTTRQGELLF